MMREVFMIYLLLNAATSNFSDSSVALSPPRCCDTDHRMPWGAPETKACDPELLQELLLWSSS